MSETLSNQGDLTSTDIAENVRQLIGAIDGVESVEVERIVLYRVRTKMKSNHAAKERHAVYDAEGVLFEAYQDVQFDFQMDLNRTCGEEGS